MAVDQNFTQSAGTQDYLFSRAQVVPSDARVEALIYAQNVSLQPLTVGIKSMLSTYGPEWDILSAGAFVTMAVPMVVFFSLQRYFVRGLLAGSVKA